MRFPAPIALPLLAAGLAAAAGGARAASLAVPLNHSVKLPVAGRAASVVVGNSKVADVTVVDSRTLFVTGKAPGSTDVTVVDPLGRTLYASDVTVSAGGGAQVTVHRGVERADLNCDPRCLAPPKEAAGAFLGATSPAALAQPQGSDLSPGATAAAAAGGLIGSAVGGALASGPLGGLPVSPRQQ